MKFKIAVSILLIAYQAMADQNKQALKALDKGDYADVEDHLAKSLESDPVNPGAYYIYSILFTETSFPRYNIDSAYYFVQKAMSDFQVADERTLRELTKNEIGFGDFENQNREIERRAFDRATDENSISSYQYFIDYYSKADQKEDAVTQRNALIYTEVQKENTWQAYLQFTKDYPDADQVSVALNNYERLLFLDKTDDGRLSSLEGFLKEYPETPYRKETERKILEIKTALNKPEDFFDFLKDYPGSYFTDEVRKRIFHVDKEFHDLKFLPKYAESSSFRDSLIAVVELGDVYLLPFYEQGRYGFMDANGKVVLPSKYEYIKEEYLCGGIYSDLLEVRENGTLELVNYQGKPVYKGGFDVATDLGAGFVRMRKNGKFGVWHKGGYEVLPAQYDGVELLGANLLKVASRGKWGLFSIYGRELLEPQFDDIYLINDYWIFEQDGNLAVTDLDSFEPLKDKGTIKLNFTYDEVELVKGTYLLCYSGDYESLINENLDIVINSSDQTIIPMLDNWLVKRKGGYSYYHEENHAFLEESFRDISYSKGWFGFKRDSTWTLLSEGFGFEPRFNQDSVRVFNDFMAYYQRGDTATLAFYPNRLVNVEPGDAIRLMGIPNESDSSQYLLITGEDSERIYSEKGEFQFNNRYDDVEYISQGYFSYESRDKKGILRASGGIALKAQYDGIGQVEDSLAPVLQKGAFGLYDLRRDLLIKPEYKKKLTRYGKYLVGLKTDGYGFMDLDGEEVSEFEFTQIQHWNDDVALVKKEGEWALYHIEDEEMIQEGIQRIDYLKDDEEEKIAYLLTAQGFGIYSNTRGEILNPSFNDIINLGTVDEPIYFAEKHVSEADFYVVVYADADGKTIRSDAFRESQYDLIVCEN